MRRRCLLLPLVAAVACAPPAPFEPVGSEPPVDGAISADRAAPTDAATALDAVVVLDAHRGGDGAVSRDADDAGDASADDVGDASADAGADGAVEAARSLRALFIGNSYTYVNDLPSMLVQMAARSRPAVVLTAESVTVGGATLQTHWETTGAQARLRAGRWDAVVLQGQSVEPPWQPAVFAAHADRVGALAQGVGARPLGVAAGAPKQWHQVCCGCCDGSSERRVRTEGARCWSSCVSATRPTLSRQCFRWVQLPARRGGRVVPAARLRYSRMQAADVEGAPLL